MVAGANAPQRFVVDNSGWFADNPYRLKQVSRIVKENGGMRVRTARQFGLRNRPLVVTFSAIPHRPAKGRSTLQQIRDALERTITKGQGLIRIVPQWQTSRR